MMAGIGPYKIKHLSIERSSPISTRSGVQCQSFDYRATPRMAGILNGKLHEVVRRLYDELLAESANRTPIQKNSYPAFLTILSAIGTKNASDR
jgi:hypothetical protein